MEFLSKIKIYDKYIFKQVVASTLGAVFLFTVIWIAPEMLLNVIRSVMAGEYSVKTGILVIAYELPNILGKGLPVGLLLGSLFTFDKLSKDSELTIFRATGLSFKRIIAPVLVFSVLITAFCFLMYDQLIPYSSNKLSEIKKENWYSQYIYTQKDDFGKPKQTIISTFNKDEIINVIVLDFSDKKFKDLHALSKIYTAKRAIVKNDKWQLNDVVAYEITENGIFEKINFKKNIDILSGKSAQNAYKLMMYSEKRDREITNANLLSYLMLLKREHLEEEHNLMLNKFYQRFAHPCVCILLAIMGCLLGFSKPREQRLVGFTIAIGAIFLYYITLPFFDLLAEKGVLPPFITALASPVFFMACIYWFYKSKDL
ncbi:MAG: LptF/LptG family permease [bacterium]|nr:LptF/LptG family permease [bacterium]